MEQLVTTKKSMYQIRVDHLALIQTIEDNEGELTPAIEEALALTQDDFNDKALSYGLVIKHFEDESAVIAKEIERLSLRLTQANRRKELFKMRLSEAMIQFGVEKIETPTLRLSFRKSEAVEIINESMVPPEYIETKVTESISKTKIKEAIKEGTAVPGAELVSRKNLQIK